jgi:hypothetical protein
MPHLPAQCERCGETFSSDILIDEIGGVIVVRDISIKASVGHCPRCGGSGEILSGPSREAAVTVMLRSSVEREDLQALSLVLNEIKKRELNRDQACDYIEQKAPRFAALKIFLPSNPGELYGFLAFLVAVATLLHDFYTAVTSRAGEGRLIREIVSQIVRETSMSRENGSANISPGTEVQRPSKSQGSVKVP